jgi:hypothetical protein
MSKNNLPTKKASNSNLTKHGADLAKAILDEYSRSKRFSEEMIKMESEHDINMSKCDKISEYRKTQETSEKENEKLTDAFIKAAVGDNSES